MLGFFMQFSLRASLVSGAAWLVLGAAAGRDAHAQALCSSDGRAAPRALLERFLSADCAACWQAGETRRAQAGDAVLDWVLPGRDGDNAPLSAVARLDGRWRAEALKRPVETLASHHAIRRPQARQVLRVAHGLAFNGYVGVSLRVSPDASLGPRPWTARLALIEKLPAGTEGSPVARNLIRNSLERAWDGQTLLSKKELLQESRVMAVPEGASPERLALLGWLEDARGRVRAIAVADCVEGSSPDTRK